jgi:hypothetical protein
VTSLEAGQVNRDGNENADMKAIQNQMLVGTAATVMLRERPQSETPSAPPIFSRAPERFS